MYNIDEYEDQVSYISRESIDSYIDLNEILFFHNSLSMTYENIVLNKPPPLVARLSQFSPRKSQTSLRLYSDTPPIKEILEKESKFTQIFHQMFPTKSYETQISIKLQDQCKTEVSSTIPFRTKIPPGLKYPSLINLYHQPNSESARLENEAFSPNTHRESIRDIPNIDGIPPKLNRLKKTNSEKVKSSLQQYFAELDPPPPMKKPHSIDIWKFPNKVHKSIIEKVNSIQVHFSHTPIKRTTVLEDANSEFYSESPSIPSEMEMKLAPGDRKKNISIV